MIAGTVKIAGPWAFVLRRRVCAMVMPLDMPLFSRLRLYISSAKGIGSGLRLVLQGG
jgi:hypothetical protein